MKIEDRLKILTEEVKNLPKPSRKAPSFSYGDIRL